MQPLEILQALYASEINCRIESFWDGGWTAVLGDEMNGFPWARGGAPTLEGCLSELASQAASIYPDSEFAKAFRNARIAG